MTKLKEMRKKMNLKLREVASTVGVTASTVHDMETRGIQTPKTAKRYSRAFPGIRWEEILG